MTTTEIRNFDFDRFVPLEEAYYHSDDGDDQIWAQVGRYKGKRVRVYYLLPIEEIEEFDTEDYAEIMLETPEDYIYDVDDEI